MARNLWPHGVRAKWLTVAAITALAATPISAREGEGSLPELLTLDQLKAQYEDAESRYATIFGQAIRYKDEGSGPVVVMLHGSNSSLDGYDGLASELTNRYRVIRFDMPGMGLSELKPESDADRGMHGDDLLKALLDELKVDQVIIIGTSSGGTIGYTFAARFPERVRAMILGNTPSDPVNPSAVKRTAELAAEFETARRTGFKSRHYWEVYLDWLNGPDTPLDPLKVDRYYDMNRRTDGNSLVRYWRLTSAVPENYATLAQVRAPTLLVWGTKDAVLPLTSMEALRQHMPAAHVSTTILEDVGHYPPFEVPERFATIVRSYLDAVVPKD